MDTEPIVSIVDDDADVRCSLRQLTTSVGLQARTYQSATEFLEQYDDERPGCLILDVRLNGMSGLDLQQKLVERGSSLPIIIITGFGDVPMALRAMRAGAVDFIEKPFAHQMLLDCVQNALKQDAKNRLARAEREKLQRRLSRLSKRQHQVLDLIVQGKTTIEIARYLGLSPKTVYAHRAEALDKLDAATVTEAAQRVIAAKAS